MNGVFQSEPLSVFSEQSSVVWGGLPTMRKKKTEAETQRDRNMKHLSLPQQ